MLGNLHIGFTHENYLKIQTLKQAHTVNIQTPKQGIFKGTHCKYTDT